MKPSVKCAKPHEWKSGAAMWEIWRVLSGIRESSDTAGSSDCGFPREAPFGVPVVPLVRITMRPSRVGRHDVAGVAGPDQLVERRVRALSESCQATKRLRRLPASSSRPSNSSS